jgi:LysR family glycine cleavage system transcriptional activator
MNRPLPPLNAVRAFEVAARHLNLSRAAEELGVTQGAISKQVSALEDYTLKEALMPAFAIMGEAFVQYSRRAPRSSICRISTIASFAAQFLIPRLPDFRKRRPDIEIEFITSIRLIDLGREEVDIGVRYGLGQYDGVVSHRMCEGRLAPICSPALLAKAKGDVNRVLAETQRIRTSGYNEWRIFAETADVDPELCSPTYVIEDFLVALKAVIGGQGVAILPEILVRDQIRSGDLALLSPERLPIEHTFHIAHTAAAARKPIVQDVIAWLKAEAAD